MRRGEAGRMKLVLRMLFLVLALPASAAAHATLLSSEPEAGSALTVAPAGVRLVFSEPLEPALSRVWLVDASGRVIPLAPVGDPRDVRALTAPVDALGAGGYRLAWRIVSADGHPAEGS